MSSQLPEGILEVVRLLLAPTLIFLINWSIHRRQVRLEREKEVWDEARYQETVRNLKLTLANPQLAELAYPNPEIRAKILPLMEDMHRMAQEAEWWQRFRRRTGFMPQ